MNKQNPPQQLVCDDCPTTLTTRLGDDKTTWPLHRCRATGKPKAFSKMTDLEAPVVREWFDDVPIDSGYNAAVSKRSSKATAQAASNIASRLIG